MQPSVTLATFATVMNRSACALAAAVLWVQAGPASPPTKKTHTHTRGSRKINVYVASKTRLRKVKMHNCLTTCQAHATFCQNGGIWGDLARLRRPGHPISGGPPRRPNSQPSRKKKKVRANSSCRNRGTPPATTRHHAPPPLTPNPTRPAAQAPPFMADK